MVRVTLSILALLSISLIAGCHSGDSAPDTSTPITEKMFPAIRDSYTRSNATVKVGLVVAVMPMQNLALLGDDLPPTDFSAGDLFTFVDSNRKSLTWGRAESAQGGKLTIRYEVPAKGSRAPMIGDVAIHMQTPQ